MTERLRCTACDLTRPVDEEDPDASWADMIEHTEIHRSLEEHEPDAMPTVVSEPVPSPPSCICCTNRGTLPSIPGLPQAVPGDVVVQMCEACIGAAFLDLGPHPHPIGF
ncbi:hypothetical protein [Microbacterium oxydans]|uniref:hypothetical protein n=1 Tax=Microbacterium oxydans TaxID=82380 RepID=UPI0022B1F1DF|nr:hypothetical protein [Microbacterium oxydans]MCZ4300765.1 hypothetical protein [Microbacterium oxydans]